MVCLDNLAATSMLQIRYLLVGPQRRGCAVIATCEQKIEMRQFQFARVKLVETRRQFGHRITIEFYNYLSVCS